jgi:hypothetical protein
MKRYVPTRHKLHEANVVENKKETDGFSNQQQLQIFQNNPSRKHLQALLHLTLITSCD